MYQLNIYCISTCNSFEQILFTQCDYLVSSLNPIYLRRYYYFFCAYSYCRFIIIFLAKTTKQKQIIHIFQQLRAFSFPLFVSGFFWFFSGFFSVVDFFLFCRCFLATGYLGLTPTRDSSAASCPDTILMAKQQWRGLISLFIIIIFFFCYCQTLWRGLKYWLARCHSDLTEYF